MRFDFEAELLQRAIFACAALALLWGAIAFLSIAAYTSLIAHVGVAWAAAITGAGMLAFLGLGVLIQHFVTREPTPKAQPMAGLGNGSADTATITALAQLAKDHPLLAVGCAALLGAAESARERR